MGIDFFFQYAYFMKGVTIVLAIIGWASVFILWRGGLREYDYAFWLKLVWVLHAALFFTGLVVARMLFGYIGPSATVTSWTHALFFHAFITMVGKQVVLSYLMWEAQNGREVD